MTGKKGYSIPDIPMYKGLPFLDDALEVYTVSPKARIVKKEEWKIKRRSAICLMPDGLAKIQKQWIKACYFAGEKCKQQVKSVYKFIEKIDDISKKIIKGTL